MSCIKYLHIKISFTCNNYDLPQISSKNGSKAFFAANSDMLDLNLVSSFFFQIKLVQEPSLTLRRPLRENCVEVFFDISKVKESSLFKSDLTDPPSDF